MKKLLLIPLLLAVASSLACLAGGPSTGSNAAVQGQPGMFSPTPSSEDVAAAADGGKGGVLGSNPSPEEFRPCLDPNAPGCTEKKKEDGGADAEGGEVPAPVSLMKSTPLPEKTDCGGTLLRLVFWKDDIRVAAGQANKSSEEFFKFLQAGELDPSLVTGGNFRDLCVDGISRETLSAIPYPPAGLHVLFKAADAAMAGLWAKPVTSADHLKSLLAGGQLVTVGMTEPPAEDAASSPASHDAPYSGGPIKIPGKK